MSYAPTDREDVNECVMRFVDAMRGTSIKKASGWAEVSEPAVVQWRNKKSEPSVRAFLLALKRIQKVPGDMALKILEPVLGPMDTHSLARRLDAILAEVGDLKNVVSIREGAAAGAQHSHGMVGDNPHGWSGAGGGGVLAAGRGEGATADSGSAGGASATGIQVVEVRRTIAALAGTECAGLAEHLNRWSERNGRIELADAVALAKGDNTGTTGVAFLRKGEPWTLAHVASGNQEIGQDMTGRAVADAPDKAYGAKNAAEFTQAANDAGNPWIIDRGASILRGGNVLVRRGRILRTVDQARDGTKILMARFVRFDRECMA